MGFVCQDCRDEVSVVCKCDEIAHIKGQLAEAQAKLDAAESAIYPYVSDLELPLATLIKSLGTRYDDRGRYLTEERAAREKAEGELALFIDNAERVLDPVRDWYVPDEGRDVLEALADAVADLQTGRAENTRLREELARRDELLGAFAAESDCAIDPTVNKNWCYIHLADVEEGSAICVHGEARAILANREGDKGEQG